MRPGNRPLTRPGLRLPEIEDRHSVGVAEIIGASEGFDLVSLRAEDSVAPTYVTGLALQTPVADMQPRARSRASGACLRAGACSALRGCRAPCP